jgi:sugar phosphate isomerase/epimerase
VIGLSTVWTSRDAQSGEELLVPILDLGFKGVELEYRITRRLYQEALTLIRRNAIQVLSIHNYFPVPDILTAEQAGGDCFSLSALDQEERERGISYTARTLESAHELETRAVVLYLGRVETPLPKNGLQRLYPDEKWNDEGPRLLQQEVEERDRCRAPHLDALLFSVEKLIRRAEQLGVTMGIENRYYVQEMPDKEEIGIILDHFRGGPIGYWHDTGHAAVFEHLGIVRHEELLRLYSPHLIGVHLHDAAGIKNHMPPGQGEIDFAMVKKYLPDEAIKIMEICPEATGDEVLDGRAYLKAKGIDM